MFGGGDPMLKRETQDVNMQSVSGQGTLVFLSLKSMNSVHWLESLE